MSIEGRPAEWGDLIEVRLADLRPTQPVLGFDRIYYKLGRYERDRRKVFDEYCENNGRKGIRDFSRHSDLHAPDSFVCLEDVGMERGQLKTVVIGPDEKLYLTDGHHTFNVYWHMPGGGADLRVVVLVSRDYRDYPSMASFWEQMELEGNIWLFDVDDQPITPDALPPTLGIEHFGNDPYRSLMYFTRRIAWNHPQRIAVPEPQFYGDNYPDMPFVEFYWVREVRDAVDLSAFDLYSREDYIRAIRAIGEAVIQVRVADVGGSGQPPAEMGQFRAFNNKELFRISRPGTGKLSYMLDFKNGVGR